MNTFRPSMAHQRTAWFLIGALAAMPLHAQTSNLEMVAQIGGRIIGAAKACGINSERIRKTSEQLLGLVNAKASSAQEKKTASRLFVTSQPAGAAEVRSERSGCTGVHVDFSEIEVKLDNQPPVPSGDPVVAKRGVPPIGALQSDKATRSPKR